MRALLIAPSFVAACVMSACGLDLDPASLVEEWQAEATAHGAMGRAGTFDVVASEQGSFSVAGALHTDTIVAPFTASGTVSIADATLVQGATLDGTAVSGAGVLTFASGTFRATTGSAAGFAVSSFDPASGALFVDTTATTNAAGLAAEGLTLTVGTASFQPAGDGGAIVELVASETAPLTIATGTLVGVQALLIDEGFTVTSDDVALGGAAAGSVTVDGEAIEGAQGVFARDVTMECNVGVCAGDGRITQVLVEGDVVIDANLEIAPFDEGLDEPPFSDELELQMAPGEARHVVFAFRERSYAGDAVVIAIEARGDGAAFVQTAAAVPQVPATTIIGQMQADGTIDAGETVLLVVAGPAIVLVDVITSIGDFFSSDSAPPQPVPIPSWVQAGQVGTFSVVVTLPGDVDDGSRFATRIAIGGANFDEQELSFTIRVDAD